MGTPCGNDITCQVPYRELVVPAGLETLKKLFAAG